jgi:hypothetical protein
MPDIAGALYWTATLPKCRRWKTSGATSRRPLAFEPEAGAVVPDLVKHRLRVGEVRVFYDVSGDAVEVLAIVPKSEAESWLARFADQE